MLKHSCYFPSIEHQNAQTFFPSHVAGSSPEARPERPKIDPGRSCAAGSRCYPDTATARKWARNAHLLLECTGSTACGNCRTKPSYRRVYWRTNRHVEATERKESAGTWFDNGGPPTHAGG